MANKKINELVTRTPSLTDLILVGDPSSGYSYKATVTALATIIETDIADGFVTLSTTQTISGAKTFTNAVLISANSPELNLNQGTSSASYINFKENSSLVNRIISSGATLTFITNNSGTAALVLSSSQTATFGSIPNATTDTDRFLVSDSGTLKYRTGAELLSDIGAASSSNISGTTNYIAKFTSSSAIGNSVIYESGGNIGISTTSLSAKLNVNGNAILTGSINATEVYLASPNGLVFQIDSSNTNGGYAEFQTNSTTIGRIGTATQVVGSGGTSVFAISSRGANDFVLGTNGTERVRIDTSGNVTFSQIANATTDTDKFLVSDSGVLKYRTGSELLSDIGGASSSSISGTTNYIPKFTSSSAIGNSIMYEGTNAIGIGTTSPNTYSGYTALTINNSSTGALLDLDVADVRTATIATTVSEFTLGSITNIPIAFITNSSERMRLDASGNLGINTSSPSYKLDVSGSGRFTGNLGINGVGPTYPLYVRTGTNQRFRIVDGGSGYTQLASLDDAESAYTPIMIGNSWVNINASGNLGLGVTPSAWYSLSRAIDIGAGGAIQGRSNASGTFELTTNAYLNSSGNWAYKTSSVASNLFSLSDGSYKWYQAGTGTAGNAISFTQAMTLDASGRLGIGTTSPTGLLTVNGASDPSTTPSGTFRLTNTAGGTPTQINMGVSTNSPFEGWIQAQHQTLSGFYYPLSLQPQGGNVGIGTTSPTQKLQVEGTGTTYALIKGGGNNTTGLLTQNGNKQYFTGTYYNVSDAWEVADLTAGGLTRLVITSGGNVGIGNSTVVSTNLVGSATIWKTYNSDGASVPSPTAQNYYENQSSLYLFGRNSGLTIVGANGEGNDINFANSSTPAFASIRTTNGTTSVGGDMIFRVGSNTERMRITSGGEVYIAGTTDQGAYNLQVNGTGVWGAGAYVNGSDSALKQNIQPLDNSLDLVKQMKPVTYNYKESYSKDTSVQTGFIAQDLQLLLKDKNYLNGIVKDGTYLSVAYQNLIPLLVKAIQEQQLQIENLKNK